MAGFYFDLVKKKGDDVLVGERRGRRLSNSTVIILLGVDLEKIMQVLYCHFLIYKNKPHAKNVFCMYCKISLSIAFFFPSHSLYVAFLMHILEFGSSLFPHLSLSSWCRNYLMCFNFPVAFFGKDWFLSYFRWSIDFLLLQTLSESFLSQVSGIKII